MKKLFVATFSIMLSLLVVSTNVYIAIANSIKEETIKTNIRENLLTGFIYDDKGDKTEIFKTILRLTTLDEETVIQLMENETADEILTDIVNSIYDYNLTGDESVKYTGEDIIRIVEENMDKILREINYNLSTKDRQEIMDYTRTHTDYILDTIYSTNIGNYTK